MKRPRASAPVNPVDVIDITDTEDEAPSPQKNTQTQPVITLKYDADGSILIDDDDEEEPVEAPERLLLPKVEKPLSTTTSGVSLVHAAISRTESVASSVQVHKPSGRTSRSPIQMPQDVERPIEEPEASAFDDNVAIEDQMQELDLGHHMDGPLHESPEGMEDAQQVSEQAVVSEPGTSPSTTPSEDADLAISTDTQLHITAEGGDQLDNADAALHDPQDITHGTSASNKLSARDMEEAPARSTRTPSFATVLSTHHRGPDAGANTTNPETSSPGPLVGSTSSRWITPLSSSARRSSKTVYGGPSGFFKDVYRSRKMSRSASRSVQGSTITSPPMSPSRERVNAVVLPEPTFESVSTRTGKAGSSADNSPGPTNPPAHEETDPRSSIGLELAYPSSRSASAPLKSNSGSPSAHARPSTQDVVNSERFAETMSSEAIPETPDADQFISASVPPDCALLEVAVPSPHEPAPNEEPIMIEGSPAPIIAETSASVVPTPPHLATSPVADAPQQPGSANVESKPSMTEVTEVCWMCICHVHKKAIILYQSRLLVLRFVHHSFLLVPKRRSQKAQRWRMSLIMCGKSEPDRSLI
ncbi:hypothetical protein DAEQUDRAFT_54514 [Daedalea quercina L-15889]|uniref:Uncharacterized protein n=1 Tax=Daedalea quercina L-15889 TaxID=1314783 RepID=A0A165SIK6_9APHY|nr:hypothetical protein DAEQUDRAFT_54514 [Daedalea quercina L-15889]